jgi:hypothetical protein
VSRALGKCSPSSPFPLSRHAVWNDRYEWIQNMHTRFECRQFPFDIRVCADTWTLFVYAFSTLACRYATPWDRHLHAVSLFLAQHGRLPRPSGPRPSGRLLCPEGDNPRALDAEHELVLAQWLFHDRLYSPCTAHQKEQWEQLVAQWPQQLSPSVRWAGLSLLGEAAQQRIHEIMSPKQVQDHPFFPERVPSDQADPELWARRIAHLREWCKANPGNVPLSGVSSVQDQWIRWIAAQHQQWRNRTGTFETHPRRVAQWTQLLKEFPVLGKLSTLFLSSI